MPYRKRLQRALAVWCALMSVLLIGTTQCQRADYERNLRLIRAQEKAIAQTCQERLIARAYIRDFMFWATKVVDLRMAADDPLRIEGDVIQERAKTEYADIQCGAP